MVDTWVETFKDLSGWLRLALQVGMLIGAWRMSRLFAGYRQWTMIWVAFGVGFLGLIERGAGYMLRAEGFEPPWIIIIHEDVAPLQVNVGLFCGIYFLYRILAHFPHASARQELPNPAGINIDEQDVVTAWDIYAAAMFGWPASEAIGHPLTSLIIPERSHQAHLASLARYMRDRSWRALSAKYEVVACHQDGSEFPVVVRISVVPLPDGHVQFAGTVNRLSGG